MVRLIAGMWQQHATQLTVLTTLTQGYPKCKEVPAWQSWEGGWGPLADRQKFIDKPGSTSLRLRGMQP